MVTEFIGEMSTSTDVMKKNHKIMLLSSNETQVPTTCNDTKDH